MPVEDDEFLYTKQDVKLCEKLRREYQSYVRAEFVKYCAREGFLDEYLEREQVLVAAEYGYLPAQYNVHHKHPLGGSGTNDFSNLCIIDVSFHDKIHRCYGPLVGFLQDGEAALVPSFGLFKDDVKVYVEPTKEFKEYQCCLFTFAYNMFKVVPNSMQKDLKLFGKAENPFAAALLPKKELGVSFDEAYDNDSLSYLMKNGRIKIAPDLFANIAHGRSRSR